ncbi:isopentenyl-diphosphate delta-isomerase [Desulfitispora alkaliphila]|uniref:type 2 isopentenyl-diphosphate Delta-isomerase n=1 Tax=Desulfitispora alkaliphila TaxID=622674 RepID=UPI003D225F83
MTRSKAELRRRRKAEHLQIAMEIDSGPKTTGFEDIEFIHYAISQSNINNISTEKTFLNKRLSAPLLIEAITGGADISYDINKKLAIAARETGIGIALGSQTMGLEDPQMKHTFEVVRTENPEGLVLANMSAGSDPEMVAEAVDMISADGVQLHLNIAQELLMDEGDRDFSQILENIGAITRQVNVPIIVKEVGFGMSRDVLIKLYGLGIEYVDVGGAGGTNFATIENNRRQTKLSERWHHWGIPTVPSLIEGVTSGLPIKVIASGGLIDGQDVAKSLALGADMAGAAMPFLREAYNAEDSRKIIELIKSWILDIKLTMALTGISKLENFKKCPLIIRGQTKEWLDARGIDSTRFAKRNAFI